MTLERAMFLTKVLKEYNEDVIHEIEGLDKEESMKYYDWLMKEIKGGKAIRPITAAASIQTYETGAR